MKAAPIPDGDPERLHALDALDIVYSPAEERFDRITRVTKRLFNVPIVLISLVTRDKQWFKSCQGLNTRETGREISFCGHAITQNDAFVVPNAATDPDFSDNPLVTGEPRIRFYAGQPLNIDGQRIGTLCLIDRHPRHLKPKDYDSLRCLANWVETELLAWKSGKNRLIQSTLELSNRDQIIDDLTGDLRSEVLEELIPKLAKLDDSEVQYRKISVKITNLTDNFSAEDQQRLIVAVSQALHRIIGDQGLTAFDKSNEFSLLALKSFTANSDAIASSVKQEIQADFEASEQVQFQVTESP